MKKGDVYVRVANTYPNQDLYLPGDVAVVEHLEYMAHDHIPFAHLLVLRTGHKMRFRGSLLDYSELWRKVETP